jgi:hypothetical protein
MRRDRSPASLARAPRRRYTVVTVIGYYRGGQHLRQAHYEQGAGSLLPACPLHRQEGKVRREVLVHLGRYEKPEDALAAWPSEVGHLRKIGREEQADKLEANLEKLRALTEAEERKG